MHLDQIRQTVGETLEELRKRVFIPEMRQQYKLTFVARHPEQPELDIVVTEDDMAGLNDLVTRRFP